MGGGGCHTSLQTSTPGVLDQFYGCYPSMMEGQHSMDAIPLSQIGQQHLSVCLCLQVATFQNRKVVYPKIVEGNTYLLVTCGFDTHSSRSSCVLKCLCAVFRCSQCDLFSETGAIMEVSHCIEGDAIETTLSTIALLTSIIICTRAAVVHK